MRWLILLITISLAALTQTAALHHIAVWSAQPDLLLILALCLALNAEVRHAAVAGWLIGLAKDFFAEGRPGLYALLFFALCYAIGRIKDSVFKEHFAIQAAIAFLASLASNIVYIGLNALVLRSLDLTSALGRTLAIAVYTGLTMPLVFALLRRPIRRLRFVEPTQMLKPF
ncbi:MAG: rod shape-determining protein MreD [Planctomycetes bacterium]|nr:rod shape-determining protein MreD [Planctomycetota bacterium]MBM4084968.1 rod shape-determining protein MreD [Planctomycetota bacterium]